MKNHLSLFGVVLFLMFSKLSYCQESTDSINLNIPSEIMNIQSFDIDPTLHYKSDEPPFVPELEKRWEKYIFQDKGWKEFNLQEGLKPLPDGRRYLIYSSPDDALHYFSASDPIFYGIDFHLKPLTNWKIIDLYFFNNGVLTYQYAGLNPQPSSQSTKSFIWEMGGGIEYEYKENRFLFYESSAVFKNQYLLGRRNKAGFRLRF